MPTQSTSLRPRPQAVLLLFAGWLAFFGALTALSVALAPKAAQRTFDFGWADVLSALVWTTLSLAIAAWHRRLRRGAPNIVALIAAHLPMLIVVGVIDALSTYYGTLWLNGITPRISVGQMIVYYLDFDVVVYIVAVAVAEVMLVRGALAERQRQAERLEGSLARARLDYLEAQLQPHFLFNSLGAVSELAYDAPATASRVLQQLAAIFRTALGKKTDEITLGEELLGIEPYLDIQRIRFADWLTIEYRVDEGAVDCLVPRFVLQPLIENAIRHGLSGRSAAGTIEIAARLIGPSLVVRVTDNGVGLEAAAASSGRGIGLANVRNRLRILYGDDDSLRLSSTPAGGTVAELRIPSRRKDAAHPLAVGTNRVETLFADNLGTVVMPAILRRRPIAIVASWFVAGMLWTQQSFVYLSLRGRLNGATWLSLAYNDMVSAGIWAALTPAVLWFANRFPLRRAGVALRLPVYALAAAGVVLAHNFAWQRVVAPATSMFAPQNQMTFAVGFFIFCILAAIGHRGLLAEWLREREAASAQLVTELDLARARAEKLQAIPPVLLRALDGIAETARHDPSLTERQLTRLADYLRLALECTDDDGITPERERALERAVAELRRTGAYPLTLSA